jgi:hypothetical protein
LRLGYKGSPSLGENKVKERKKKICGNIAYP